MTEEEKAQEMFKEIRRLEREYGFKLVADMNFDICLQSAESEFSFSRLE